MGYYFGKGSRIPSYGERGRREGREYGDPTGRKEQVGDRKVDYDLGEDPTPVTEAPTNRCREEYIACIARAREAPNPMEARRVCRERYQACKEAGGDGGGDGGDTGDTTGDCSGGYRLADNPLATGGGQIWEDEVITSEMGFARDPNASGHWLHKGGRWFHRKDIVDAINSGTLDTLAGQEGGMCSKGYQPKNINGETWCCPGKTKTAGDGDGPVEGLGWWEPPPEMQGYYGDLMERGREFLDRPLGFTPEMMNQWFGKDFDLIRGMEAPLREQSMSTLGREGMIGTGAVPERMGKIAWDVESGISDLSRNLFIESEMQKKRDILDYTGKAQDIFGQGMGYNQLIEAINASRRGERQAAMDAFTQWLAMMSWR